MARARNIKPAFFLNTDLSEIQPLGRLAFIGLWTLADYKGCLECNFKKIKAQILPYDECNLEELLNSLEQYRFIRYYFVQGKRYIKIENFERHQNPHKNEREAGSDIPDIDKKDNENNDLTKDGTKTEQGRNNDGIARADSLLLIPDSLNPHTVEDFTIVEPTAVGLVCVAIKREFDLLNKQITDIQQTNPTLHELIKAGATPQEFAEAAKISAQKGKGFSYLLSIVKRQREEAANLKLHHGAMPASTNNREQGRTIAANSIFKDENIAHLQGEKEITEVDYEPIRAIAS